MGEFLVWRDNWLLGIDDLDADHKEMVRLINDLADTAGSGPIMKRLNALTAHLHAHFSREERLLDAIDYPDLAHHASEHVMQLAEFTHMRHELQTSGSRELGELDLAEIKGWFLNHVVAEDQRFAEYYHHKFAAPEDQPGE